MSYLGAGPGRILAVDLNPAHLALLELKLAAARHLADYAAFRGLFVDEGRTENLAHFRRLAPHLSPEARAWWQGRGPLGRPRSYMLGRNLYAQGLLGRTIGLAHLACRLHGRDPSRLVRARTPDEQRATFEAELAPVLRGPPVRALSRLPVAYFGLGIPPAQLDAMRADAGDGLLALVRERLERLACDFPVARQLVRLAGLRPPLPRGGRHPAALPAAGGLGRRARPRRPGRAAPGDRDRPAGAPGRGLARPPTCCSTPRTG